MNCNIAHDVYIKKAQSIELANQVNEFLTANGLPEPTQIPFGFSGENDRLDKLGIKHDAQSTMRQIMFNSVAEDRKKKSTFNQTSSEQVTENKRISFNREARTKAFKEGKSTFVGQCIHHGLVEHKIKEIGLRHVCSICYVKNHKDQSARRKKSNEVTA